MENTNEIKNTTLTDEQVDELAKAAEDSVDKDVVDIRKIAEETTVNPDAPLEAETVDATLNEENEIDLIAQEIDHFPAADVSIFDVDNKEAVEEAVRNRAVDKIKGDFNISDEDTYQILEVVTKMKDGKYKVYDNLPKFFQDNIDALMAANNIPVNRKEDVARFVMNEFVQDADVEQAFIDFQKSIDEALNMPSISDLYSEHTRETMEVRIPAMIEKIKDEFPDKAETLEKVRDAFKRSYTFSYAKECFENSSHTRKAVRRYELEFKRCLDNYNYCNSKSQFKMTDAKEMPIALRKILIDDAAAINVLNAEEFVTNVDLYNKIRDLKVTEVDIKKFCILITITTRGLNPDDVIDAAYMYYLVKNIAVLRLTQEAKTDFSVELINNICDMIAFIRNKEAEFYGTTNVQSGKKLHSNKANKR